MNKIDSPNHRNNWKQSEANMIFLLIVMYVVNTITCCFSSYQTWLFCLIFTKERKEPVLILSYVYFINEGWSHDIYSMYTYTMYCLPSPYLNATEQKIHVLLNKLFLNAPHWFIPVAFRNPLIEEKSDDVKY